MIGFVLTIDKLSIITIDMRMQSIPVLGILILKPNEDLIDSNLSNLA